MKGVARCGNTGVSGKIVERICPKALVIVDMRKTHCSSAKDNTPSCVGSHRSRLLPYAVSAKSRAILLPPGRMRAQRV